MADPKEDRLNAQDLAAEYNYAYALLMSDLLAPPDVGVGQPCRGPAARCRRARPS